MMQKDSLSNEQWGGWRTLPHFLLTMAHYSMIPLQYVNAE